MVGTPKKRAKREAAGKPPPPPPPPPSLEEKVAADQVEDQIRSIAAAAEAERGAIRGTSRFSPRAGIAVDGLPEVERGAVAPPLGAPRPTAGKALEVLSRNLELALSITTDYLAELLELENRPDKKQVSDCAEAWGLVLETYSGRMLETHPELAVAATVTLLAYGPMGAELYLKRLKGRRAAPAPGVATAAEVAAGE